MAAYSRWDRLSGVWRGAVTLSDGRGARADLGGLELMLSSLESC